MMSTTTTGIEALQLIKEYYPNSYGEHIKKGKNLILSFIRIYNLSEIESVQKALNETAGLIKDHIEILAALYVMLKNESLKKKIEDLDIKIENVKKQIFALENSESFNTTEANNLRGFYNNLSLGLNKERESLVNQMIVITTPLN